MTFQEFKKIVTTLHNETLRQHSYLKPLPYEVHQLIQGNQYSESLSYANTELIYALFGENAFNVITFLEASTTKQSTTVPNILTNDGKKYCVYDLESYFDYAEKELFNGK